MNRTLLLIFAFLAFVIGSFVWMVATFDASEAPTMVPVQEASA